VLLNITKIRQAADFDSSTLMSDFISYLKSRGCQIIDQLEICSITSAGNGLCATGDIDTDSTLFSLPASVAVHGELLDLLTFILVESGNTTGEWSLWASLWPSHPGCLGYIDEIALIEGTTLYAALAARIAGAENHVEAVSPALVSTNPMKVLYAEMLAWSRAVGVPSNHPSGCTFALIPLLDMCNHSFTPNARWEFNDDSYSLVATKDIGTGEEICISYGDKSNEELMYLYGFCTPDNQNDTVMLLAYLEEDDPLVNEKVQLLRSLQLPARFCINNDGSVRNSYKWTAAIVGSQQIDKFSSEMDVSLSLPDWADTIANSILRREADKLLNVVAQDTHSRKGVASDLMARLKKP